MFAVDVAALRSLMKSCCTWTMEVDIMSSASCIGGGGVPFHLLSRSIPSSSSYEIGLCVDWRQSSLSMVDMVFLLIFIYYLA